MGAVSINEENVCEWKEFSSQCVQLLQKYRWLIDAYILDFFVDQHWSRLPEKWKFLDQMETSEIAHLISSDTDRKFWTVFPLSLLAFLKATVVYRLPRFPDEPISTVKSYSAADNVSPTAGSHLLENLIKRHVKPKKQHEINTLGEIIHNVADSKEVVDVGSGCGHLSRLLTYKYGLSVTCIEASDQNIQGANKFDSQIEYDVQKKRLKYPDFWKQMPPKPNHITYTLSSDMDYTDFIQVLDKSGSSGDKYKSKDFVVCGLHACGDLSTLLLRLLVNCPQIVGVCSVSCCYMKLTSHGYPMSGYIHGLANHQLSYQAMEVACHALEIYTRRLCTPSEVDKLKIHCYRAIAETFLIKKSPELKHAGLQSVKNGHLLPFHEYAKIALRKVPLGVPDADLESSAVTGMLCEWKRVLIMYILRLKLAPVVETLILLDRMIYLMENSISNLLVTGFDPLLSPRNYIHIALKSNDQNTHK